MTNLFRHAFLYFLMLFHPYAFGMFPFSYLCPPAKHAVSVMHCHNPISMFFAVRPLHSFLLVCPLYHLTKLRLSLSKPWSGAFSSHQAVTSQTWSLVLSLALQGLCMSSVVYYFACLVPVRWTAIE